MPTSRLQLEQWLLEPEGPRLEFKEAKQRYDFEKLLKYCVALANEGGGKIILGVTDKRPRRIVGTQSFAEPGRTEAGAAVRVGVGGAVAGAVVRPDDETGTGGLQPLRAAADLT